MANLKIHEYPLERLNFGDNDYYDIDYYDGVTYQSAKILGSVIKNAIAQGVATLYNSDGVLDSDRIVNANLYTLVYDSLRKLTFNVNPAPLGSTGVEFNVESTGPLVRIVDTTANKIRLEVTSSGAVRINEAYSLPLADGTNGQVLATDGAGALYWTTAGGGSGNNIYNTDGTLTGNRVLDGASSSYLVFNDLSLFAVIVKPPTTPPFNDVGAVISVDPTYLETGSGRLFKVQSSVTNTEFLGVVETGELAINNAYTLPNADGVADAILTTDGAGNATFKLPYSISSTQWANTLASPVGIPSGTFANGMSFFTDANKVAGGTTSYDEYNLSYGRKLTLTGTGGTANITLYGNPYPITFNTDLNTTAQDWVNTYQTLFNNSGIQVFNLNGVIRFGSLSEVDLVNLGITNTSGNLTGTYDTAVTDHIVIPYAGKAYEGYRIHHTIRVNFNLVPANSQFYRLALVRWENDTIIGSYLIVERNNLLGGYQFVFETYTAGGSDSFVSGGFYFAFFNDTGQNVEFTDGAGILIQNQFQKPINF